MRQISFQNALDDAWCVFGDNVTIELAAERGVRAKAAADQNVIAPSTGSSSSFAWTLQASKPISDTKCCAQEWWQPVR
jgi:hypothetical protein